MQLTQTQGTKMGAVAEIQDREFDTVLSYEGLVVIHFTAPWCRPCPQLNPIMDQLAEEHVGHVKIVKIDINQNQKTPQKLNVRILPTVLIFKQGELVEKLFGAAPYERFSKAIKQHL